MPQRYAPPSRLARTHAVLSALLSGATHEDAERMSRGIGVDEQWLVGVIGSITEQARSFRNVRTPLQTERPDSGVEMQHLRSRALWPSRFGQTRHLLEGQANVAIGVPEHQPVLTLGVRSAIIWRLVAGTVLQAEQLSIELREGTRILAVQYDLSDPRHRCTWVTHACIVAKPHLRLMTGSRRTGLATSTTRKLAGSLKRLGQDNRIPQRYAINREIGPALSCAAESSAISNSPRRSLLEPSYRLMITADSGSRNPRYGLERTKVHSSVALTSLKTKHDRFRNGPIRRSCAD